jgi:hypothetical protein
MPRTATAWTNNERIMIPVDRTVTYSRKQASARSPDFLVDGLLLLQRLCGTGGLGALADRLRVRREGGYQGLDVVVFLLMLFAARQRMSIKEFGAASRPHRRQIAMSARRNNLPAPASISRFLDKVEDEDLAAFIPWLLLDGAGAHDCLKHPSVLARDCQGDAWHVFDFDPTSTVLRQRALPAGDDLPKARRRSAEAKPGYPGRKRGDVQLTRATLQHAGSGLWLGVWVQAGNGNWRASSTAAIDTIVRTCTTLGHDVGRALVRVDGAGGNTPFISACESAGIRYVTRSAHYQLLEDDDIRRHLDTVTWYAVEDSRSGPQRHAAELGAHLLSGRAVDDDGQPFEPVRSRVVVSRIRASEKKTQGSGRFDDGWHYELFLTNTSAEAMPAPEVVTCYYQRTGIENRFRQEDKELGLDRIFSYHIAGQNLATLVGLFVWNLRICCGFALHEALPEVPPQAPRVAEPIAEKVSMAPRSAPTPSEELEEPVAATVRDREVMQHELAHLEWPTLVDKHDGWQWDAEALSLKCPAGQVAEVSSIDTGGPTSQGSIRFAVAAVNCRSCPMRAECTPSTDPKYRKAKMLRVPKRTAERLKAIWPSPVKPPQQPPREARARQVPHWTPPTLTAEATLLAFTYALLLPATLRQLFAAACRNIDIHIVATATDLTPKGPAVYARSSAERQNRRLTWDQALARNALPPNATPTISIESNEDPMPLRRALSRPAEPPPA